MKRKLLVAAIAMVYGCDSPDTVLAPAALAAPSYSLTDMYTDSAIWEMYSNGSIEQTCPTSLTNGKVRAVSHFEIATSSTSWDYVADVSEGWSQTTLLFGLQEVARSAVKPKKEGHEWMGCVQPGVGSFIVTSQIVLPPGHNMCGYGTRADGGGEVYRSILLPWGIIQWGHKPFQQSHRHDYPPTSTLCTVPECPEGSWDDGAGGCETASESGWQEDECTDGYECEPECIWVDWERYEWDSLLQEYRITNAWRTCETDITWLFN